MRNVVPPGLTTMEGAARHLAISGRKLQTLTRQTPLSQIKPLALGRSLGTYRFIPRSSIVVLQQLRSPAPWHVSAWIGALRELLMSAAWREATDSVAHGSWNRSGIGGGAAVEAMLLAPQLQSVMELLDETWLNVLMRHGLDSLVQVESMLVDRIENDEDAVVLVGSNERAYILARSRLEVAGLDYEKARGIVVATHTGEGIVIDVWPIMGGGGAAAWQPDSDLLRHRIEVGA